MFLAPSAGNNYLIWIVQRLSFPRCRCQIRTALCIWRRHLMRNLILWAISSLILIPLTPHHMALQVSKNSHTSQQNWSSHTTDEMTPVEPTVTAGTSQCGQVCTMSQRMAESVSQRHFYGNQGMHYMASQATTGNTDEDLFHDAHLQLQRRMRNPIVFHAEMMGDIMYLQQALKQPDAKEFVQAVIKEVNGHVDSNNWMLQKWSNVPEDIQIVSSLWSLQCKCNLTTNELKSHKNRLNLHGVKQVYGMNYFETYAPAVTWFTIRLMITFRIIFCWALQQVDFVMAYP